MRSAWTAPLILVLISSAPLCAQNPLVPATLPTIEIPPETPRAIPAGAHPLTAADLETFLDGFVPLQLDENDIAGATIAIVKDGQLLFARGYGYADFENKKPVLADATLFRPGSVSKLFTWTAVMQLAEEGKLDLDRDVNSYLDFRIPERFGKPVTLKHLLTHTPGWEDQVKDLFIAAPPTNLGGYVKSHIPRQIFPPGTTSAYSNYGATLAGYIVERASGRPFDQYVEEKIFKPLGMNRSTFVQPLPAALAPLMSKGYNRASDGGKKFEVVGAEPAGSVSATATDMARFMIAHLQGGELGGVRILRPETVRLMHSRLFELNPASNGMAYGFLETSRNGHRIIGHAGDTEYFHSDLHLIPDASFGFFVSYNSAGRGTMEARAKLWDALLDRYFPDPVVPRTLATAKEDARSVSGRYIISRRNDGSFLRAMSLIGEMVVKAAPDGTVTVSDLKGMNGKPRRWREIGRLVFRDVDGKDDLAFRRNGNGRMEVMLSPYPVFVFQRVGLWEDRSVLVPVIVVSLLLMVLTLLSWPVAALVRRHYRHPLELTPADRWSRLGVRLVLLLDILFLAGMAVILVRGFGDISILNDRIDKWIYLAQILGVLGAVGTVVVIYDAFRSWSGTRRIWSKLYSTLLAVACLGFLWFVFAGNLLRFTSRF